MKKEVITVVEICDGCQKYQVRYKCEECGRMVCHNCVRDFAEFQRRVKRSSLNVIRFCPECSKKDISLLRQLQRIKQLREEWWDLVDKYDDLANQAEEGIEEGY